jgi:hypothetical protein
MKQIQMIVILSFFFMNALPAQKNKIDKKEKIISIFGYTTHTDQDGKPSRDDVRYKECNLYLYATGTFKLVFQTGRVAPTYETKSGTWEIVKETLVLHIEQRQFSEYQNAIEQYSEEKSFMNVLKQDLSNGVDTLEYRQGLRSEELFSEYTIKSKAEAK